MSYEANFDFYIGSQNTGLTIFGQILDDVLSDVGAEITTGIDEINSGHYGAVVDIPDAHSGFIEFYASGTSTTLASFSIKPTELENADVKTSTRSTLTQANILSDATPFAGANIDAAISSRSSYTPASDTLEGALTYDEVFRIVLSALAGLVSGGGTTTLRFRDYADSKDRIVATVTAQGNRTVITLDGS